MLHFNVLVLGFAAALTAAPAIKGVYNAGSWIPPSLPNSGVAQGAIFTVTGTGLGPATLQEVTNYPLPTTQGLGGTVVQVKVGAVTETCIMVYTVATQVAAILPSATPVGLGTLTLSYQGLQTSIVIQVVAADFGTFTLNEGGSGPAVVTDLSYNAITMVNAAHPGDTLILWGTGLGAVTGDETEPPSPVNLTPDLELLIENQPAVVSYGGRSSSPGLDQINFTVPQGISGGCKTSIAVGVRGVVGNVTTMAVAPVGQTTCGDTYGALTADNLKKAVSSGSLNTGVVSISRVGADNDQMVGYFQSYPLNSLIRSYGGAVGPSIGSCISYELAGSSLFITDPIQPPYLDSGPSLVISPQGRPAITVPESSTGSYSSPVGTVGNVFISPGVYSVSNGNGGTQVPAFNWSLTLPNPVAPSNLPATVNRAQSLTLTWSGGAAFPVVSIFAFAGVPLSSTENSYVEFICTAQGPAGQFTIPPAILSLLPANGYGATGVPGIGIEFAGIAENRFTVAGTPGLDAGLFTIFTSTGGIVKVQ